MERNLTVRWIIFVLLCIGSITIRPLVTSAENGAQAGQKTVRLARIDEKHGVVEFKRAEEVNWNVVEKGMLLYQGDRVRTGVQSSVDFRLEGGETSEVRLTENTEVAFDHLFFDESEQASDTLLDLSVGKILITSEDLSEGSDYNVRTPTSLVGIRGTAFEVEVS